MKPRNRICTSCTKDSPRFKKKIQADTRKKNKFRAIRLCNIKLTRLALASVLGPFGTFVEIHSTHPGALMHYSRFQSLVPTPVVNPDSSPKSSPYLPPVGKYSRPTYIYPMIAILQDFLLLSCFIHARFRNNCDG